MKAATYKYQLFLSDCRKDNQRTDGEVWVASANGLVGSSILSPRPQRTDH